MEYHKDEIAKALDAIAPQYGDGAERVSWLKKYLKKQHDFFTLQEVVISLSRLGYKKRVLGLLQQQLSK